MSKLQGKVALVTGASKGIGTKGAVDAVTGVLAKELGPRKIRSTRLIRDLSRQRELKPAASWAAIL